MLSGSSSRVLGRVRIRVLLSRFYPQPHTHVSFIQVGYSMLTGKQVTCDEHEMCLCSLIEVSPIVSTSDYRV